MSVLISFTLLNIFAQRLFSTKNSNILKLFYFFSSCKIVIHSFYSLFPYCFTKLSFTYSLPIEHKYWSLYAPSREKYLNSRPHSWVWIIIALHWLIMWPKKNRTSHFSLLIFWKIIPRSFKIHTGQYRLDWNSLVWIYIEEN